MNEEIKQERIKKIRDMAIIIDNDHVKTRILSALDAINNPKQGPIVTNAIKETRKAEGGRYRDLALELANLAYEIALADSRYRSSTPYFLGELCVLLRFKGEDETIIRKINDFFEKVESDELPLTSKQRNYLAVTLAHAYKGKGDISQGIRILENLRSSAINVLEALAELYYVDNKPGKTIELLKEQKKLTVNMAFWLAKSYLSLSQREKALQVLEPFKSNPKINNFYQEISTEYQQVKVRSGITVSYTHLTLPTKA